MMEFIAGNLGGQPMREPVPCSKCGRIPQLRDFGQRVIVLCSCYRSPLRKTYEQAVSAWNEGQRIPIEPFTPLFSSREKKIDNRTAVRPPAGERQKKIVEIFR